uniref:Retrotransposon Copia-like N-terminal domain-containing protein n=1 Tax=Brassica oleracea var. oleracea TaxID=109376 RepID=A0A0D3E5W2_BRAOL
MKQYKPVMIPVTLKGGNYITWSRLAKTALGGRGLWEHITTSEAPRKITQGADGKKIVVVDEGKWDKVFGLLLTLNPSFNDALKHILRAKELPSYDDVCAQLQKELGSDSLLGGKGELSMANKVEKVENAAANKAHFKP